MTALGAPGTPRVPGGHPPVRYELMPPTGDGHAWVQCVYCRDVLRLDRTDRHYCSSPDAPD